MVNYYRFIMALPSGWSAFWLDDSVHKFGKRTNFSSWIWFVRYTFAFEVNRRFGCVWECGNFTVAIVGLDLLFYCFDKISVITLPYSAWQLLAAVAATPISTHRRIRISYLMNETYDILPFIFLPDFMSWICIIIVYCLLAFGSFILFCGLFRFQECKIHQHRMRALVV